MARTDPRPRRCGVSKESCTATYDLFHPLRPGQNLAYLVKKHGDPELEDVQGWEKKRLQHVADTVSIRTVTPEPCIRPPLALMLCLALVYRISVYESQIKKTMDQGEEAFEAWLECHERRQQRKKSGLVVKKPVERAQKPAESEEAREVRGFVYGLRSCLCRVLTLLTYTPSRLHTHLLAPQVRLASVAQDDPKRGNRLAKKLHDTRMQNSRGALL